MGNSTLDDGQLIKSLQQQIKELQSINQKNDAQIKKLDTDSLTGLLTREAFFRSTREMLDAYPNEKFIFLRFDVDKFQTVNTLFGYEEGDRLLKHCANAIHKIKGIQDLSIAGHLDADIFCICYKFNPTYDVGILLNTDIDTFLSSYRNDYRFNISIGQYHIQDNTESTRSIYSRATIAARKCKDSSDFYLYKYDTEMDKSILHNQLIASEMHNALENKEFEAFLQPKVDLKTQKLVGAEALVRWIHPKRGLIPPNDFIPLFEQNGFILKLDRYMFKQACIFIRGWIDAGITPVPISINLSQVNFTDTNLIPELLSILDEYKVDIAYTHLEITESAYSVNTKQTLEVAKDLTVHGFHLEMDDFGTGISSLTMLNELPVKTLKLDLRFIQSKSEEHNNGNILNFIVSLGKQMQMELVAEGIETEDQLDFLKSIGCNYGQGYLFSRPVPKEEFDKLLTSWTILEKQQTELNITSMLDMNDLWFPNSKFNLLFNTFVGGVAIYEVNNVTGIMKTLRANEDYLTVLTISKESHEMHKKDVSNYIFKEDLAVLQKKIIESIKTDTLLTTEIRIASLSVPGKITWVRLRARIVVRTNEKTLFLTTLENTTAEKKLAESIEREKQLHKDYRKQLAIYESANSNGVATMRIEKELSLVYANSEFLKIFECSREYAFSNADTIFYETFFEEDLAIILKTLKFFFVKKRSHFEWAVRILTKKENIRSTLISGSIRYEENDTYIDIVIRDITDSVFLAERLKTPKTNPRKPL